MKKIILKYLGSGFIFIFLIILEFSFIFSSVSSIGEYRYKFNPSGTEIVCSISFNDGIFIYKQDNFVTAMGVYWESVDNTGKEGIQIKISETFSSNCYLFNCFFQKENSSTLKTTYFGNREWETEKKFRNTEFFWIKFLIFCLIFFLFMFIYYSIVKDWEKSKKNG